MPKGGRQLRLGVFFNPTGHHVASWKHSGAQIDAGINLQHYVDITQTAERGKMDMVFFQDSVAVRRANIEALSRSAQYIANFEPITLLSALAMVTKNIGLTATASTSYNEPFHVARKFASLDHISGGRAGWNLVTSVQDAEAQNFGRETHFSHAERYERAREFAEVVKGLWDSWDDDAFLRDVKSGLYFDKEKLHTLDHKGKHFSVKGPLNVPRPIQGHPVIVQAGASEAGIELAAETAEAVFCSPNSIEVAQAYYADLKGRTEKFGRTPDDVKVLPGLSPVVASTMSEAEEKFDEMQSMIDPIVAKEILATVLGYVDLSGYDLDDPVPELGETNASKSTVAELTTMAKEENLTIRELAMRVAGARGKLVMTGTPSHIADFMEDWLSNDATDGFNILPSVLPASLNDFVDLVIPELQRRDLFRTEYQGSTLRDNLGLKRPVSRYNS
ncbi:MAG: LLM class flavin-dependent oxidoreductase [Rhodospirillaceae bacterium]|jgi:N-acetyl-S-(2-succino)cysteine monooxygenase|nr:LLM class flavin-dependent oxidoreductase [Rhodospirillaceae bacterium]MBT4589393.1 LLM class flavin-dependent oxidoreductase [Rhodospirillaceae bacterium]MBT5939487.1 LLM class flavin-dependent oxidoreductase [Rhodospirillaceae bacterium]